MTVSVERKPDSPAGRIWPDAAYNRRVSTDQKPRLVVLDSHGILFRAFFALANSPSPLMTSKGELTFATYGFAESLLRVFDQLKPTHICAAWDAPGKTFRHEADEAYKATRRETPADLLPQMARVREMLEAFNIPIYEMPGFEADDVAGSIARAAADEGIETYIVTLDTDLVQLLGPRVHLFMFRPYQRDTVTYDVKKATERWGFEPPYIVDFKALKGDSSDNVPGIKGIGEKTAADLIRQFGPVESIFEHLDEIQKPSVRSKLAEAKEQALHNKQMVTIRTDLDVGFDLDAAVLKDYDRDHVVNLFRELEFRTLLQRLPESLNGKGTPKVDDEPTDYRVVMNEEALAEVTAAMKAGSQVAVVSLSTAGDTAHPLMLGIALATEPFAAWYIPVGHAPSMDDNGRQLSRERVAEALRPFMADERLEKVTYGGKYIMHAFDRIGMPFAGIASDLAITAWVLGETSSTPEALANERLGIEIAPVASLGGTGRSATPLAQVAIDKVAQSACAQADVLLRLRPVLDAQIEERNQQALLKELELPLQPVLFRMERLGIALDKSVLRDINTTMTADIEKAEREIYESVGHEFNIGSPKALSDVLFNELGLPKSRKTTQGYSTDQRSLEALRPLHPVIDLIFRYRQLTKLKSTYLDALPATVAEDGRIHTDFQQTVASTGRLSSTNPNLQNIPVRSDVGASIRRAFVASYFNDATFVAADYSQIELRVLAHITGDQGLIDAFLADEDIHRATAATVYGVQPEDVTRRMRDLAKVVNFGIVYGMGEYGLASRTELTREEAADFINTYYTKYPKIRDWQKATIESTRENGYAETLFGRRRYLPAIRSSNFQVKSAAEREAVNMPIQGTAADIIKVAMIRVDEALRERELQSRMLLQVHDELIFECPMDEVDAIRDLSLEIMPASLEMAVPLKVEVKQGRNWGELE
jgi:DNA polymerase I